MVCKGKNEYVLIGMYQVLKVRNTVEGGLNMRICTGVSTRILFDWSIGGSIWKELNEILNMKKTQL